MNYKETIDFLFSQLPMFQRLGKAAYKANLDNTLALDEHSGFPHRSFKSIHIAGTNGKGSVAHMMAAILQTAGYKTGLYTSPHLKDFRERIRIDGTCIPEEQVIQFVSNHKLLIDKLKPSFFEMTVAMAFDFFKNENIDVAVIEVGMGGRLDSTNIITPVLSVITNIGMDHTQYLGESVDNIAREKAEIIKPAVPVVIGQTQEEVKKVFLDRARQCGSPISFADQEFQIGYSLRTMDNKQSCNIYRNNEIYLEDLETDQLGLYQRNNIITLLKVLEVLEEQDFKISREAIYTGLSEVQERTGLRGRWEVLGYNPLIVCDTGHNTDGIKAVVDQIQQTPYKDLHIIFGMVDDKDPERILALLPGTARYYFTQAGIPRAMDRDKLALAATRQGIRGETFPTPVLALEAAKKVAKQEDMIFIGGSTFVVAEVL